MWGVFREQRKKHETGLIQPLCSASVTNGNFLGMNSCKILTFLLWRLELTLRDANAQIHWDDSSKNKDLRIIGQMVSSHILHEIVLKYVFLEVKWEC